MTPSHLPALEVQMAEWDRRAAAAAASRQSLRDTFERELREIDADKPPYDLLVLVQGLSHITETRALRGRLREQLSPMFEGPQPVFRAFASGPVGVVSFDPSSGAGGNVATFEGDSYPYGDVGEFMERMMRPIYALLAKAQDWAGSRNVLYTSQLVEAFVRDEVRTQIRSAQARERFPRAADCPVCGSGPLL